MDPSRRCPAAPGWACICASASSKRTGERSACTASWGWAAPSSSRCRPDELELSMVLTLDLMSVLSGILVSGVLLHTSSVVVAGKRLRRTGGEERTMQATRTRRSQRSSDFLENLLRRSYYGAAIAATLGLILLPFLPVERGARLLVWLSLTAASFVVAFVLLLYWHSGDEEREARLLRTLRAAGERRGLRAGLNVHDRLTGLYTPEYWLHALELRNGRLLRRGGAGAPPAPRGGGGGGGAGGGGGETRGGRGAPPADELLRQLALQILADVRPSFVVCRHRGGTFPVPLLRCPAD